MYPIVPLWRKSRLCHCPRLQFGWIDRLGDTVVVCRERETEQQVYTHFTYYRGMPRGYEHHISTFISELGVATVCFNLPTREEKELGQETRSSVSNQPARLIRSLFRFQDDFVHHIKIEFTDDCNVRLQGARNNVHIKGNITYPVLISELGVFVFMLQLVTYCVEKLHITSQT